MEVGAVFWEKLELWEGCFGVRVFHFSLVLVINPGFQIRLLCESNISS